MPETRAARPLSPLSLPLARTAGAFLACATLAFVLTACGGGGGSSPTEPPPPGPPPASGAASFRVEGAGGGDISYENGPNQILCTRNAGFADLFLRFAQQPGGNPEPRLDIDLCNLGDGGGFTPMDPQAAGCGGGKTFDLFWHAADGTVYANTPTAPACALMITRAGEMLTGSFSCRGLAEIGGGRVVDVVDGMFECVIE